MAGVAGEAWCSGCRPADGASLLGALRAMDSEDVHLAAAAVAAGGGGGAAWLPSQGDPCPLCGGGEAGNEHLIQWCPAAQAAWEALHPEGGILREACQQMGPDDEALACLLHQLVYLHGTMRGRCRLGWRRATHLLLAGVRQARQDDDADEEPGVRTSVMMWAKLWRSGRTAGMATAMPAVRRLAAGSDGGTR